MEGDKNNEEMVLQLILVTMEALLNHDLASVRRFKAALEEMPKKSRQTFIINLKKLMSQRAYYRSRVNEKQYEKFIKMADGMLFESYKGLEDE